MTVFCLRDGIDYLTIQCYILFGICKVNVIITCALKENVENYIFINIVTRR